MRGAFTGGCRGGAKDGRRLTIGNRGYSVTVPAEKMALDIGPQTIELFKQEIRYG